MAYLCSVNQFNVDKENWWIYQKQMEQFLEVNKLKYEVKKSAMLSCIGHDAYKIDLCTLVLPKDNTLEELCKIISPLKPIFFVSETISMQQSNKVVGLADFSARLCNLSITCNFGTNLEVILIDKFVFGLKTGKIKDLVYEEQPDEFQFLLKLLTWRWPRRLTR